MRSENLKHCGKNSVQFETNDKSPCLIVSPIEVSSYKSKKSLVGAYVGFAGKRIYGELGMTRLCIG